MPGVTIPLDHERPLRFDAAAMMVAEKIAERSMQEIFSMFIERKVPMYVWVAMLTAALSDSIPGITERLTIELLQRHGEGDNFNKKLGWAAPYIMKAFMEAFPNDETPERIVTAEPGPPLKPNGPGMHSSVSELPATSYPHSTGS